MSVLCDREQREMGIPQAENTELLKIFPSLPLCVCCNSTLLTSNPHLFLSFPPSFSLHWNYFAIRVSVSFIVQAVWPLPNVPPLPHPISTTRDNSPQKGRFFGKRVICGFAFILRTCERWKQIPTIQSCLWERGWPKWSAHHTVGAQ